MNVWRRDGFGAGCPRWPDAGIETRFSPCPTGNPTPFPTKRIRSPPAGARPAEIRLKNDRYVVRKALAFSNAGGVYRAYDQHTGQEVVLKEARPRVFFSEDAVALLGKGIPACCHLL